jgi:hypothetical protein
MADRMPPIKHLTFGEYEGPPIRWAAEGSAPGTGWLRRALGYDVPPNATRPKTTDDPGDIRTRLLGALASLEAGSSGYLALAGITYSEEQLRVLKEDGYELKRAHADFARLVMHASLGAYESGEMEMPDVVSVLCECARYCRDMERYLILGLAVERMRKIEPKKLKRTRPKNPKWVKDFAVDLVESFLASGLDIPLTPPSGLSHPDPNEDSILKRVTQLLAMHRLCPLNTPTIGARLKPDEIGPTLSIKTLHKWYRDRQKAAGNLGRAKPRKRKSKRLP